MYFGRMRTLQSTRWIVGDLLVTQEADDRRVCYLLLTVGITIDRPPTESKYFDEGFVCGS
jgi:hypothetical protein